MMGLAVDPFEYHATYTAAGLLPPKDHTPVHEEFMVYDDDGRQAGYATSFMYSPVLQRHIALARIRPDLATPGQRVRFELTINHRYEQVAAEVTRNPMFNPPRKTAHPSG
jgi:glycine cleavage system aminomethyltransferase T